ncbi:MAG: hypothetical protein KDK70_01195 [Myxococcales bacterium]|nr:hypothetical protein [Myxococcales bacterium]
MPTLRASLTTAGLGVTLLASGCVERLIHDLGQAGGGGGRGDVETDGETEGLGETEDVVPGTECREPQDCGANQTCFEGVCVGVGTLRISLSWSVVTDLDLHLFTPSGDWINFDNPTTAYGELDVDDCVAGTCQNQQGTHVENIFLDASAPRGTYGIQVVNFDGRASADYAIVVAGAVSDSTSGTLPAQEFSQSLVYEITW